MRVGENRLRNNSVVSQKRVKGWGACAFPWSWPSVPVCVAVGPEYRLQPEVNKGLQARSPFFLKTGVMGTGLKPLNRFRLKGVLTYCNSLLFFYQELMKSGICLWKPRILALFLSS